MSGIDWEALREFGRQELQHVKKCSEAVLASKMSPEEAAAFTEKVADEAEARRISAGWSDGAAAMALDAAGGEIIREGALTSLLQQLRELK